MDTIFALATASGKAGVSIVRISGPSAYDALASFGVSMGTHDRKLAKLRDIEGEPIDEALVLTFAEGRSFTAECIVELHLHGSPAIVSKVMSHLSAFGLRTAKPGEFTNRAMENGVLDLAQVEGLADLIDAETEAQRRQAMQVFGGALGELADGWRRKLVRAAALLEATIDFVEEDVPVDVRPEVKDLLSAVLEELRVQARGVSIRERIRDGFEIAIVGLPNAGKSTLLNSIAGRDAAITSEVAGTTRDVIEVRLDIAGLPVTLLDTAGLRESDDLVESIGIERGKARASAADIRVHLSADLSRPLEDNSKSDLFYYTKADIFDGRPKRSISAVTGSGVEDLIRELGELLSERVQGAGIAMRVRHQLAIEKAISQIEPILINIDDDDLHLDLLVDDLRVAMRALDALVGRIDVENVLDEIFSSFCIGK